MTAQELIKELQKLPPDTIIMFDNFESYEEVQVVDTNHDPGTVLLRDLRWSEMPGYNSKTGMIEQVSDSRVQGE